MSSFSSASSTSCSLSSACTSLLASWNSTQYNLGFATAQQQQQPCNSSSSADASSASTYSQPLHIAAVFIILACSGLGPAMPLLSKYHPALAVDQWYYILGKSAGIGVILACGFVHMLQPGSQSLSDPSLPSEFTSGYQAYAFLYAMLAILAMHALDTAIVALSKTIILNKVLQARKEKAEKAQQEQQAQQEQHQQHEHQHRHDEELKQLKVTETNIEQKEQEPEETNGSLARDGDQVITFHLNESSTSPLPSLSPLPSTSSSITTSHTQPQHVHAHIEHVSSQSNVNESSKNNNHHNHHHHHHHQQQQHNGSNNKKTVDTADDQSGHGHGDAHDEVHNLLLLANELPAEYSYLLRFGMLEFGLTTHSIIIGLTTGIVSDSQLRVLLVALSFHQFFEGLALGARLAIAHLSSAWHAVVFVVVFASSAPIGLALGVALTSGLSLATSGPTFFITQGTFDSVCGGILIYLGVTLLTRDFQEDMDRVCRGRKHQWMWRGGLFAGLYLGAGLMAFLGKYM